MSLSTVNRMYDSRRYAEDNRTESIVRTRKSEAEVTKKNCAPGIVLYIFLYSPRKSSKQ